MIIATILIVGGVIILFSRKTTNNDVFAAPSQPTPTSNILHIKEAWALASRAAQLEATDPKIVLGVMRVESAFNVTAINPNDPSYGLMQLIIPTAMALANWHPILTSPHDNMKDALLKNTEFNVRLGARFIGHLQRKYSGKYFLEEWIQAYNIGEPSFDIGKRAPLNYGGKVIAAMQRNAKELNL
ncbi:MAG: transglycosylase SLT domain-containing protein [Planctomycetota bacterium]|jgi:soluble lytic murein transglycosylase-like protein